MTPTPPLEQNGPRRTGAVPRKRIGDLIIALVAVASLAILGAMIDTLRTAYNDVELRAEREAHSLLEASVSHLESQLALWDLSLKLAADIFHRDRFATLNADDRILLLSNLATNVSFIGSLLVLDRQGNISLDPMSPVRRTGNFSDRDYFLAPQQADVGTFISQPYRSRLRNHDPSIALSRRITGPDGGFDGVVMIAVRLASIRAMFDDLDPGQRGAIAVINAAGRVLMRHPSLDGSGDVDLDLSASPNFRRMLAEQTGSFSARAVTDGTQRLYVFTTVPGTDLLVSVGLAENEVFSGWYRRVYITIAVIVAMCAVALLISLRLRAELARREAAEAQLAKLARTDPLTGLANRRVFEEFAERELRRSRRTDRPLSMILIDADHFKAVNDRYGHAVGDTILQLLATVMTRHLGRPGDLGVRFGGEEFIALLADTGAAGAAIVADRIRQGFETATSQTANLDAPVTVSIGVAELTARMAGVPDLVAAADRALYRAKASGRNRVMRDEETTGPPDAHEGGRREA